MQSIVTFASAWIGASELEDALWQASCAPHAPWTDEVAFVFPAGCKLTIVAIVRFLSLVNQLDSDGSRVRLVFEEGECGTMGYVNRMGFFERLSDAVEVVPARPEFSSALAYFGENSGLVEIAAIVEGSRDDALPEKLASAVSRACAARPDVVELAKATWNIFAELINNIGDHSASELDGFASLQVYPRSNSLQVVVSDSGLGIMETLRPALKAQSSQYASMSDLGLLVEVFKEGISRFGPGRDGRGCGLRTCGAKAIRFRAELDVRLAQQRVWLIPGATAYEGATAKLYEGLPLLRGTHIAFRFPLG